MKSSQDSGQAIVVMGQPPIFFFDECHMLDPSQTWGKLLHKICKFDATVVPGVQSEESIKS